MGPFDRVREAVTTYRKSREWSKTEHDAAAVAADACEEAGLLVDAAWYRFVVACGIGDRPEGEPLIFGKPPAALKSTLAALATMPDPRRGGAP